MGKYAEPLQCALRRCGERTTRNRGQAGTDRPYGGPVELLLRDAETTQDLVIAERLGHRGSARIAGADEQDQALGQPVHGVPIASDRRGHEDGQGGEDDACRCKLVAAGRFQTDE